MLVRAIKLGYYGGSRRKPGDVFQINEKAFSKTWMVKVEDDAKVPVPETKEVRKGELFPASKEKVRGSAISRDVI